MPMENDPRRDNGGRQETGAKSQPKPTSPGDAALLAQNGAPRRKPKKGRSWAELGLSDRHRRKVQSSAITADIAKLRGYKTLPTGSDAELAAYGFGQVPQPSMLIPLSWNGETVLHQIRPDNPPTDEDGNQAKYLTPKGAQLRLDCPPGMQSKLSDPALPLLVTEGSLKADAAAGVGLPCISVTGVDCWQQKGRALPDWDDVPLVSRTVFVVYDSDVMMNQSVWQALDALTDFLRERGATVRWVVLPQEGKQKVGLDDYLADDHTADELLDLARTPEEVTDEQLRKEVRKELRRRRTQQLADAKETAAGWSVPPSWSLAEAEEMDWPPLTYPIAELHPTGANVLLTAQYKTGKTTLVLNEIKALVDGDDFLGRFAVDADGGPHRVAWLNFELTEEQAYRWLAERGVHHADQVFVMTLRGHKLPVRSSYVGQWWVQWLAERKINYLFIDPFRRAYDGENENDNTDVGRWLAALDEVKRKAEIPNLMLITHTGRAEMAEGQERARGATTLDDWADVRWTLTRDGSARFLAAYGRDVDVPEFELGWDPNTRALSSAGGNRNRAAARVQAGVSKVLETVSAEPGITSTDLRTALTGTNTAKNAAMNEAKRQRLVTVEDGKGKAQHWFPAGAQKLPRAGEKS